MNDRFKFRVWNKLGKFYDSDYLKLTQDGYLRVYHDGIKFPLGDVTAEHIVEQCTGLRDKNGKLIYEGDVVKTQFDQILTIYFFDGAFKYRWACGNYNFVQMIADDCEIIGNVHEMEVAE